MVKWVLLLVLAFTAKADTNITWQFPYIRPLLFMRGTNSFQYDTCWEFENWNVTNPVGTLVLTTPYTNLPFSLVASNWDTNFNFVTSNHISGRTYYYNTAYRQVDLSGVTTNIWATNPVEILVAIGTNTPPPTNSLKSPKMLYIYETW